MQGLVRKLSIGLDWDIDNQGLVKADRKTDGLVRSADRAEDEMGQLGRAGNRAGNKISRAFGAVTTKMKAGLGVLSQYRYQLGAAAAAGAFGMFKLTSMAGDATETINKFRVVFGDFADESRQWAKEYSDQIGRSEYATLDWLNSFQDVLVPMGLARDEAAKLSQEMVTLAADLGSFNNVATSEAANLMQSAMIGNHRAVRSLGIQLSEATLDLAAQRKGYEQNFAELDNLTKMQLRFEEMIRQSSDAVNDATRTSDEYNNQILALKGNLRDLGIAIGNSYIPNMTDGLNVTNDFLDSLINSEWTKPIARIVGLTTAFTGLAAGIGIAYALAGAIGIGAVPLAAIIGGIGLIILAVEDLWTGFQGGESVIFNMIDWFDEITGESNLLGETLDWLGEKIGLIWEDLSLLVSGFIDTFTGFGEFIVGIFTFDKEKITDGFETMINGLGDMVLGISNLLLNVSSIVGEGVTNIIWFALGQIGLGIANIGSNIINSILWIVEESWNSFVDWIEGKTGLELPKIEMPEIDILKSVQDAWTSTVNWWNNLEILDVDFNVPDIKGLIEQEWNDLIDWWEGLDLGFDFDFDLMKSINKQLNKLPDWTKKLLNIEDEVIEKESKEIQNNNSTNVKQTEVNENIEINVDGSKSPEEVAKIIERKLKTRERVLGGEVGM